MSANDIIHRDDIDHIIIQFYQAMLKDPIIGFIFTDVAKIDLEAHLPVIGDFWQDVLFKTNNIRKYQGNALQKHLELNELIGLKSGHFTRWLYLFNKSVDDNYQGENAQMMKTRAEMVAKSISAAIADRKKSDMSLVLP